jgi:hypothetical protein
MNLKNSKINNIIKNNTRRSREETFHQIIIFGTNLKVLFINKKNRVS